MEVHYRGLNKGKKTTIIIEGNDGVETKFKNATEFHQREGHTAVKFEGPHESELGVIFKTKAIKRIKVEQTFKEEEQ